MHHEHLRWLHLDLLENTAFPHRSRKTKKKKPQKQSKMFKEGKKQHKKIRKYMN